MQTINISLPKNLFDQIRLETKEGTYASVSEFFREAARHLLRTSAIGFNSAAEEEILGVAKTSAKSDVVFDHKKTNTAKMFKKIRQAKI